MGTLQLIVGTLQLIEGTLQHIVGTLQHIEGTVQLIVETLQLIVGTLQYINTWNTKLSQFIFYFLFLFDTSFHLNRERGGETSTAIETKMQNILMPPLIQCVRH